MFFTRIIESTTSSTVENFGKATELIIKKPQVLSKVLTGAQIIAEAILYLSKATVSEGKLFEIKMLTHQHFMSNDVQWERLIDDQTDWLSLLPSLGLQSEEISVNNAVKLYVQHAIPKNTAFPKSLDLFLVNDSSVLCVPLLKKDGSGSKLSEDVIYRISYHANNEQARIIMDACVEENNDVQKTFLTATFKRFLHYCGKELTSSSNQSLCLVNMDKYNDLYNELKTKYADFLISNWSERTDAKKFVYEDIAIAAYLLVLLEEERLNLGLSEKQSFLDIGCGNGLLVYLLTKEGHPGTGYDIRKRKIWEWFQGVDLQERTLIPSGEVLFPDYDWLIGNHSDEMTPWIPVISARSGYDKRFFVLPCCPHDFNGKFRERKSDQSVYQAYLDYVEEVVGICGFDSERDMLRIPSTKRTCIIGRTRYYDESQEEEIEKHRAGFIQYRCERLLSYNGREITEDSMQNNGFTPRAKEEKVRNCTQIDQTLKTQIVETVFKTILSRTEFIEINGRRWNKGCAVPLGELVSKFDKETMKKLKSECGGLQTLLKNHHQMFRVVQGQVGLRFGEENVKNKQYLKTSLCYYHLNHPDGCWQSRDACSYAHGQEDLRKYDPSQNFS